VFQSEAPLVARRQVGRDLFVLGFAAPEVAEAALPGQFVNLLLRPGPLLRRPFSVHRATDGRVEILLRAVGVGTAQLIGLALGDRVSLLGPLGTGFRLDVRRPLLVGGGIGIAPLPYLSDRLGAPRAVLGFRSESHAQAADLVPNAEVVVEPTYVTDVIPPNHDVLACGPEAMLAAVRGLEPAAQLAWEAPMACGYGACYGCAVEIDGELRRLCVDGPVLESRAA